MRRTFQSDAIVVVEPVPFLSLRGGDLVACTSDTGDSFLHYVFYHKEQGGGISTYSDTKYMLDRFASWGFYLPPEWDRRHGTVAMTHQGEMYERNVHGVVRRAWILPLRKF